MDLEVGDFLKCITTENVWNAMRSFGSKKVPCPDGFKPIVLKNLNEKAVIFLTELYKMSIRTEPIPSSWRKMEVIFIPKPGKEDYSFQKIIPAYNTLILCVERVGENHAMVPERKSYYKSIAIKTCLCKKTLNCQLCS